MTSPAHLASGSMHWRTPEWFLDLVRRVAPIGVDPCGGEGNPCRAERQILQGPPGTPCGLSSPWDRRPGTLAFVNPPYGPFLSGPVDPDYVHRRKGQVIGRGRGWAKRIVRDPGPWMALVPSRTDAEWYHTLLDDCDATLLWRSPVYGARIQFVDPTTGEEVRGSTTPSTVFFASGLYDSADEADRRERRHKLSEFQRVFAPHGRLLSPNAVL